MSPPTTKHGVYRVFDVDGVLLYIGQSDHIGHRLTTHSMKSWGDQIHSVVMEWHPTREAAVVAETAAIIGENPLHNIGRTRAKQASPGTNKTTILRLLNACGPSTQVELERSAETGDLGRAFVGPVLARLVASGHVVVVGERPSPSKWGTARIYAVATADSVAEVA